MARIENNIKKKLTLLEKLTELAENISEEFEMIELIENNIKEILSCDLNCTTCSIEEQRECISNFKKMNLYWLRKIVQDEQHIKKIVEQMIIMKDSIIELADALKISLERKRSATDYSKREEENINRLQAEKNGSFNYFT